VRRLVTFQVSNIVTLSQIWPHSFECLTPYKLRMHLHAHTFKTHLYTHYTHIKHICTHIYTHMHMHKHTHTHMYTHTHIHT